MKPHVRSLPGVQLGVFRRPVAPTALGALAGRLREASDTARPTTEYGGKTLIVLNEGLFFRPNDPFGLLRPNPEWVVQPWFLPDGTTTRGTERFILDLLLRFTVRQHVLEVEQLEERGYMGFGSKFTEHANRIGLSQGLPPVVVRRRSTDHTSPIARGWPHCVRPSHYYLDDVTEHALDLARSMSGPAPDRKTPVPSQALLELIQYLLVHNRADDARRLIERQLEWVSRYQHRRPRRQVERGSQDPDGQMPGEVKFDRNWLDWNTGTVLRLAQAILATGSFWELPILADALQEAGCGDEHILQHLYAPMEHGTPLLGAAAAADP